MKHSPERECNVCGRRCFISSGPCANEGCTGTMCQVIIPLPSKRVSGVLCRDKTSGSIHEICFVLRVSLTDITLTGSGSWRWPFKETTYRQWTLEEWKNEYGKLPRKGSKSMVII